MPSGAFKAPNEKVLQIGFKTKEGARRKNRVENTKLLLFPALVFFVLPWDQGEHDSYSVVENRNSSPVNLIESDENGCEVDFYNK